MYVCVVHTDIADMATKFNVSSFTQYTLNRACLPPTSTSTSSTFSAVSTETSTLSSFVGKQFGVFLLMTANVKIEVMIKANRALSRKS